MGMAGFRTRPVQDDDPLVCSCGTTLGTKVLEKHADILAQTLEDHQPEHQKKLRHQATHRNLAGPCPECS